ncbi:restriction system protein [Paenibacillus favisporus]|uniref:Restriction system protein n=1 Tax=Paenibacillus favisporus TaxID=221028 RepID=A0ABV2F999_9BACL
MAKTYKARGHQIATGLRALFAIIALSLFLLFPKLHWGVFIGVFVAGLIIGPLVGELWVEMKRAQKKSGGKQRSTTRRTPDSKSNKTQQVAAKNSGRLTDAQLITADIHSLSGTDFERLMELYYKNQGYSVERIGGAGDHEVDLILRGKEGYKIAVQCKRWKQNVGNDIVLRLKAGKQVHGCYDAWVVTTSNFTEKAREAAEGLNIKLINGIALENKLNSWKKKKRV